MNSAWVEGKSPCPEKILVAGSGSIGRRHLANLRRLCPSATIGMLCRPESVRQQLFETGADVVLTSIDQAIAFSPTAAVIANPAPNHVALSLRLADSGCHLLVEKPLADSMESVDVLISNCQKRQLTLMVGYCLRFFPSLQAMIRLVHEGAVGRVLHVMCEIGQFLPDWRLGTDYRDGVTARASLGGGAILELSHEIDIARWIGGPICHVVAGMGRVGNLEVDVEDCADILVRFSSGARGVIHQDLLQRPPTRRTRVVGTEGTAWWDGLLDVAVLETPSAGRAQIDSRKLGDRNEMYLDELRHFFGCVFGMHLPLVDGYEGREVLRIALAAKQSAANGGGVSIELATNSQRLPSSLSISD
jgi:predicted dehydrogenase